MGTQGQVFGVEYLSYGFKPDILGLNQHDAPYGTNTGGTVVVQDTSTLYPEKCNSQKQMYPQLPAEDQSSLQYPYYGVPVAAMPYAVSSQQMIPPPFPSYAVPTDSIPYNYYAPPYPAPHRESQVMTTVSSHLSNAKLQNNVQRSVTQRYFTLDVPDNRRHSYAYENRNGNRPMTNITNKKRTTGHFSNEQPVASSVERYTNKTTPPEYTRISPNLYDEMKKNPHKTSVPFYYKSSSGGQNGSGPSSPTSGPDDRHWHWKDSNYVRLPQSPLNHILGRKCRNWDEVVKSLTHLQHKFHSGMSGSIAKIMEATVTTYCPSASQKSNFAMLDRKELSRDLTQALPYIIDYALILPSLLSDPIPLLKSGYNKTIYLSRKLCCSLLANAFFCTFPEGSLHSNHQLPDFNFFRLLHDTQPDRSHVKVQKIKCLLNYFSTFITLESKVHHQIVSFERRCVRNRVSWGQETAPLCKVKLELRGKIEEAEGMLQVEFANKLIGGGVLGNGSVMEEIRFCISPELIVARLFTEVMDGDEVMVITGSQIYSEYSGYGTSFKFTGTWRKGFGGNTDGYGRTLTQVVAMDAICFKQHDTYKQYDSYYIDRELHKSWVAFLHGKHASPVATGNWGCGAFKGDPELKFLIQWMAASQQDRKKLVYHILGDHKQAKAIQDMVSFLAHRNVSVGELYRALLKYQSPRNKSVFQHVYDKIGGGGGIVGIGKEVINSIKDAVSKI